MFGPGSGQAYVPLLISIIIRLLCVDSVKYQLEFYIKLNCPMPWPWGVDIAMDCLWFIVDHSYYIICITSVWGQHSAITPTRGVHIIFYGLNTNCPMINIIV